MQPQTRPVPTSTTHKGGFRQTTQKVSVMCTFPIPIPIHHSQETAPRTPSKTGDQQAEKIQKMPFLPTSPVDAIRLEFRKPWRKGREREEVGRVPATRTRKAATPPWSKNKDPPPKTPGLLCKCRSKYSRRGGSRSHSSIVRQSSHLPPETLSPIDPLARL